MEEKYQWGRIFKTENGFEKLLEREDGRITVCLRSLKDIFNLQYDNKLVHSINYFCG